MDPINQLVTEHKVILTALKFFDKEITALEENKLDTYETLEKLINFFKIYADDLHHGKEEQILFYIVKENALNLNASLIKEIESEHITGREKIKTIKSLLQSKPISLEKKNDLVVNARDYYYLLTAHIEKENEVLFKEIDRNLPKNLRSEIERSFDYLETNEIGRKTIQEQAEFIDLLNGR